MAVIQQIVEKLKHALSDDDLDANEFENILELLTAQEKIKIRILDFEYYNEERLEHTKKEKVEGLKSKNYELAASWRDKELEALSYLELKEKFNIKYSGFHFEGEYLFYFYLGTGVNDKQVKKWIEEKNKISYATTEISKYKNLIVNPKIIKEYISSNAQKTARFINVITKIKTIW